MFYTEWKPLVYLMLLLEYAIRQHTLLLLIDWR